MSPCSYIVESPRWLLLKGRKEEAFELLRKIARVNGASRGEIDEMFVTTTTTTDIGGDTDMDDMKNVSLALKVEVFESN